MQKTVIGQRWISESEPELGIGTIIKVENSIITLQFSTSNVTRKYKMVSAPLQRVKYDIGDSVFLKSKNTLIIEKFEERNGLYYYGNSCEFVCETEISDIGSFNTPESNLKMQKFDKNENYNLRYETLKIQNKRLNAQYRGLYGARINLLSHQLYISNEVTNRIIPRVMLSDEVGLGKTIEASLILKRLMLTNRVKTVLIIVPEHLVFQWFCELFHRFNLSFTIIDEKYCKMLLNKNPEANPFIDTYSCICSLNLLKSPIIKDKITKADWDMIIIDEAHSILDKTNEYQLIKKLSKKTYGLMLLTAVPEHPGIDHYFARLHLLDPARYYQFDKFFWEMDRYQFIAELANKIISKQKLNTNDIEFLKKSVPDEYIKNNIFENTESNMNDDNRKIILNYLIDQHGLGRVFYRNTRKNINDFPERKVNLIPLEFKNDGIKFLDSLIEEYKFDAGLIKNEPSYLYENNPIIKWLVAFLKNEIKKDKCLLICRTKQKVEAITKALIANKFTNFTFFHEDMELLKRDKSAGWFKSPNGPQILISSEIGSEGRNFQFCNHLVLFDIPFDPDCLEQRIGRLDRIGQKNIINIHVPYISNSPQEYLILWLHNGLTAFSKSIHGLNQVFNNFADRIRNISLNGNKHELEALITETQEEYKKLNKAFETGRDRLIELNSFNVIKANAIKEEIEAQDNDEELEYYLNDFFEHFGFKQHLLEDRTYLIKAGNLKTDAFPRIDEDGLTITYNREKAVDREDIAFITLDHFLVDRAVELVLNSQDGNCAYSIMPSLNDADIIIEAIYILECIAPADIMADRFLAPTPIRVLVNDKLEVCTDKYSFESLTEKLINPDEDDYELIKPIIKQHASNIISKSKKIAEQESKTLIDQSLNKMKAALNSELNRLIDLKKVNDSIKDEEIEFKKDEIVDLEKYISNARLRIDAIRVIN